MEPIQFKYDQKASGVGPDELEQQSQRLQEEIMRVKNAIGTGYETEYASINLSSDAQMITQVKQLIEKKRKTLNAKTLVVIGIGGSSLGTVAVHETLNGVLYNEFDPAVKLYFVDTIDTDYLSSVIELVERELARGGEILVNVVTKSGTTTETIINFQLFLELLHKHRPDSWAQHVVVTSDEGSQLWEYAQQEGIDRLAVPKTVGGRYSVLSPVGLFPLGFIGIDIDQLCLGASSVLAGCTCQDIIKNPAALSAALIYVQYQKGCVIHDTFIFSRGMRAVGDWYRQLVGESLGKKRDRAGDVVNVGITPTVSVGTNDLHSVVQLYLGGPRDKFTTFVTLCCDTIDFSVPRFEKLDSLVANIQGKTVAAIRDAVVGGVQRAYQADGRPFVTIELPEKSAFCLGQFLQMKMIETMYLGYLLGVNPFDQPQVELYKKETREILAGS